MPFGQQVLLLALTALLLTTACASNGALEAATVIPPTELKQIASTSQPSDRPAVLATTLSVQLTQEAVGDIKAGHPVQQPDSSGPTPTAIPQLEAVSPIVNGELEPWLKSILQAGSARTFPSALLPDGKPIADELSIELWTEFLTNSYIVDITGFVTEYCANGSGFRLGVVSEQVGVTAQAVESLRIAVKKFGWGVVPISQNDRGFEPGIAINDRTETLTVPDGDLFPGWSVETGEFGVFDNFNCGGQLPFDLSPRVLNLLLEGARVKEFPEALLPDAQPLTWDESIALWTEYSNDTLVIDARGFLIKWCSDGTGSIIFEPSDERYNGSLFNWDILTNRGHPTNQPRVKAQYFTGPSEGGIFLNATLMFPADGIWRAGPTGAETLRFEYPVCGK